MVTPTKRVLLVEDDEKDYLIVRDLLSDIASEQFEVEWVKSVDAARQALDARKYDVCLVNHRLGGQDGLQLIKERASDDPPFILLASNEDHQVDVAATTAGAMDYLLKNRLNAPLLERSIRYAIERGHREKELGNALHQSRLLSTVVGNLSDGMIIVDAQAVDYPIVFVNDAFCVMTGYSFEEIWGRNCRFLQGPETDPQTVQQMREAIREQRPFSGVILNYRKDGTPFWNGLKITPVFDGTGKLINFVGIETDITARRQAEIALLESEARKAAILETALDCIITIDHQSHITEWNPAAEKTFGHAHADVWGRSLAEVIIPPSLREAHRRGMQRYFETGEGPVLGRRIEVTALHADGREFPVELAITRIASDGPAMFCAYLRDITERKQAEERLRQSEANLRASQQIARLGSWELDLTDAKDVTKNPLRWSDEIFRLFGYQPGEIEVSNENFLRCVHPDDRARVLATMEMALRENRPYQLDHRIVWPDGTERVIYAQAEILRDEVSGAALKMVGIGQDITERRRAEATSARLVAIVESSEDAIISETLDGIITTWNIGAQNLYGYTEGEAIGQPISMLAPADLSHEMPRLLEQIRRGEPVRHYETARICKDGSHLDISLSISPLRDAQGHIIGASSIKRDITQRKRDEEELRRTNELLKAITEGTTDVVFAKNREGRYLMINGTGARITGKATAEILGKTNSEIFASNTVPDFFEADLRVLEQGEVQSSEESLFVGGVMHTSLTTRGPLRDGQGKVVGIVGISRDITKRKQVEDELREREEFQRTLLGNFPNGAVYVFNRNFEALVIAGRALETAGFSARDLVGQALDAILPPELVAILKPHYQRAFEGESVEFESSYEGQVYAVVAAPLRDAEGNIPRIIAVAQDITARKRAEEQRDRFFTMALDMMSIAGVDGYFKRVNPAYTEILGWSEAELLAHPYTHFVHPDDLIMTQSVATDIAEGNSLIGFENRYRAKDGSWHWLEWKSVTILEEGLIYGTARDITERKQNEVALARTNDELETRVMARTTELKQSERQALARARQHEAVADLGKQALSEIDLDALLIGTVSLVAATLEVDLCSFWELLPDNTNLRLRATVGLPAKWKSEAMTAIGTESQVGYTALVNEVVVVEDLAQETRFSIWPVVLEQGITNVVTVPVKDGSLYGVLATGSKQKREFNQSDHYFLQAIANVLASAIARKRAETEILQLNGNLQGANDELRFNEARLLQGNRTFADLTQLRATDDDELQSALHQITEAGSQMLDVERCSVWTFNAEGTILHCLDSYERSKRHHSQGFEIEEDEHYFPTIKTQRIVVANDALTDLITRHCAEDYLKPKGIVSVLDVALVVGGESIGVLCCEQTGEMREWQAEDQTFAGSVASACSLVLESRQRAVAELASRQARNEAQQAQQEAERANAAKSEFLSRMSHELRTPLNAILGFGQILERQNLTPLQLEGIGHILKGGTHLLGLVNEILDISRVEAGQSDLVIEPIALASLVAESCDLVRPLLIGGTIRLVDQLRNVPQNGLQNHAHAVLADRQRLKQVLLNLLSNAIKYNRESGEVIISARESENGRIQLRVQDTGVGLTPQNIQKLFTPFERLHAADSTIEGTGLGLVISRRLIEVMGGTLGVESTEGEGSTFWIELPGAEFSAPDPFEAMEAQEDTPFSPAEGTSTVLYIEDNASNLNLVETIFEMRPQWRLLSAMRGKTGLDLARGQDPDLILLDLNLPDMDGTEVLSHLQQSLLTREIPVVVLSADAIPKQIEQLLNSGAKAYLTKPFDVKQLLSTLDEALQKTPPIA